METPFVDTFEGIVSLKPNIIKSNPPVSSIGVQSKSAAIREIEAQTDVGVDVSLQTDDTVSVTALPSNPDVEYNWHTLNDFLLRTEPMILRTIADNRRTARLFATFEAASAVDEREANVVLEYSLKSSDYWPDGAQAVAVSWNSSGTTVAVACGRVAHDDWCTHIGFVMTWNIDRARLNVSKADHVYEMGSCCTCLAFHPGVPNLFVCCTYTGDATVWSLSEEGEAVATGQTGDQGPINCVAWIRSSSQSDTASFATGGADGCILIWALPSKGRTLTVVKAFQVRVANLPRSVRGKVGGESRGTGVSTLSMARPPLVSRFMVGTETGGVFQCSSEISVPTGNQTTISGATGPLPLSDPVMLIQKPHNGPVYSTAFHPRQPTVIGSCGADGFVRIGGAFKTLPAVEIDTACGNIYDFSWSPLRPCVLACVSSTGRLLIFDFVQTTDRPVLSIDVTTDDRSGGVLAVAFNPQRAHILAVGDSLGNVKVWNLGEAFSSVQSTEEQLLEGLVAGAERKEGEME